MSQSASCHKHRRHRQIAWSGSGIATSDGAGVKLSRVIGQPALPDLDPFLLLDAFGSDDPTAYIAGFPSHPHRGFETVTYMLAGRMRHRDNKGHEGLLTPGAVQWMTAGRGIIHSEMPEQDHGRMQGFQLWVNLPARDKMTAPRYQDISPAQIPVVELAPGVKAKLIAGELGGVRGPVDPPATEPVFVDLDMAGACAAELTLPSAHNAFVYLYDGTLRIGADRLVSGMIGVLTPGEILHLKAEDAGAKLIVAAGKPLGEPVAKYGPFVMNTEAELRQAVLDFRAGLF